MDQPSASDGYYALTALAQAAASMHEMYTAFVEAGFTEQQAMTLVTAVVTGHLNGTA